MQIPASKKTAVVLHHSLTIEAVERVLQDMDVTVVAKTSSPTEALEAVRTHSAEMLILDIDAHDGERDGLSCLSELRGDAESPRSIVLSAGTDRHLIDAAFDAGAEAYLVRTAQPEDLAAVIRQAFERSVYLPSMRRPREPNGAGQQVNGDGPGLTRREIEILKLVAEGHSNGELARMLWVTEQTVKFHLSNIYRKLGVSNRTEASRWAHVRGLVVSAPAQSRDAKAAAGDELADRVVEPGLVS
jgi:DNA-binding NarL/FixJ family response regulator